MLAPENWFYTLRNQLVHGGSTWNSSVNRGQLWGDPCYPVVE
jgi:hypothetical protein